MTTSVNPVQIDMLVEVAARVIPLGAAEPVTPQEVQRVLRDQGRMSGDDVVMAVTERMNATRALAAKISGEQPQTVKDVVKALRSQAAAVQAKAERLRQYADSLAANPTTAEQFASQFGGPQIAGQALGYSADANEPINTFEVARAVTTALGAAQREARS